MTITTQARPQVLTKQETEQAVDSKPAEKKSGISLELKLHIDKEVVTETVDKIAEKIPMLLEKAAPVIKGLLPDVTDATAKLIVALGPEAQKILATGVASAVTGVGSAVSQVGALTMTALSGVKDTMKDVAMAPVNNARKALNVALTGAKLLFGG